MRASGRFVRVFAAWAVALAGCTTEFELQRRVDAGAEAAVSSDLGVDAGLPDAPADAPSDAAVDAPPGCREPGDRCCPEAMRGPYCTAGLVCSEGFCARCPGTLFACGNACVDLQTSTRHCSACGAGCADGQRCVNGGCVTDCSASTTACGGRCVDLSTDAANCGACGRACTSPNAGTLTRCREGACQTTCNTGYGNCDGDAANGCEADTQTAAAHCGGCGQDCAPPRAVGRCAAGACSIASCVTGYLDCDGNVANGCEVDQNRDASHCGGCGRACTGGRVCQGASCVVPTTICPPGFADCQPGPTVCEADITGDRANCGGCGRTCAFANATAVCAGGTCSLGACAAGYFNCDGAAGNGCERRVADDPMNCGGCGVRCAIANGTAACRLGACAVGACDPGFLDCDGNAANGCEVDSRTNLAHCGGCGRACAAPNVNAACADGSCQIVSCTAGYADCDGRAINGCEVSTATDPLHCGRCENLCAPPNAASSCAAGACVLGACNAGYGNCDGVAANGCEVDTRTSVTHCGACGRACTFANAAAACGGGVCALGACNPGYANCDGDPSNGCEVALASSGAHCGACGRQCPTANVCNSGTCVLTCPTGQVVCNGACVDLSSNAGHCGACGRVCTAGPHQAAACESGRCTTTCAPGYGDCDGDAPGCEADLRTDRRNCGACNLGCASPTNAEGYCANATCTYACRSGFGDCDGSGGNGCEVTLQSDRDNCGRCNVACLPVRSERYNLASSTCVAGACQFTCRRTWGDCNGVYEDGCEESTTTVDHCGSCGRSCNSGIISGRVTECCPNSNSTNAYMCCTTSSIGVDICSPEARNVVCN